MQNQNETNITKSNNHFYKILLENGLQSLILVPNFQKILDHQIEVTKGVLTKPLRFEKFKRSPGGGGQNKNLISLIVKPEFQFWHFTWQSWTFSSKSFENEKLCIFVVMLLCLRLLVYLIEFLSDFNASTLLF